jgi:hypothetical protein
VTSPTNRHFVAFAFLLVVLAAIWGAHEGRKYQAFLAKLWGVDASEVTLYKADYWMGELVEAIVERGEYRACYPDARSAQPATVGLCFSAHRMPVVPLFMAAVAKVANSVVLYMAVRSALFMALLCAAMWLILSRARSWWLPGMVLMAVYVVDPANLLMLFGAVNEETFLVPQMALIGALLFARPDRDTASLSVARLVCLTILVMLMPMTKSSAFLPAAAIAVVVALLARPGRVAPLLPLAGLAVVMLAWGQFTYRATGHFAFGNALSSLNGYNLHHGYTIHYGEVAPRYHLDLPVSRGQIKVEAPVRDEWELNRHFTDRALAFIHDNPWLSLRYLVIKAYAAILKVTPEYRPYVGEDGFFLRKHLIITAGLLLDRLIMWLSLVAAAATCWATARRTGWRSLVTDSQAFSATAMLVVSLAFLAPFIVAFSTFRHIVPLYYFQVAYLMIFALQSPLLERFTWATRARRLAGGPVDA